MASVLNCKEQDYFFISFVSCSGIHTPGEPEPKPDFIWSELGTHLDKTYFLEEWNNNPQSLSPQDPELRTAVFVKYSFLEFKN